MIWAFNEAGRKNLAERREKFANSDYGQLLKRLEAGEKLSKAESLELVKDLRHNFTGGGTRIAYLGVFFDFSRYLHKFIVEDTNGDLYKFYAFNKSEVRAIVGSSRIVKIWSK